MGDTGSPRCGYTGSPNHNLGATDPRALVSIEPCCNCEVPVSKLFAAMGRNQFGKMQQYGNSNYLGDTLIFEIYFCYTCP